MVTFAARCSCQLAGFDQSGLNQVVVFRGFSKQVGEKYLALIHNTSPRVECQNQNKDFFANVNEDKPAEVSPVAILSTNPLRLVQDFSSVDSAVSVRGIDTAILARISVPIARVDALSRRREVAVEVDLS